MRAAGALLVCVAACGPQKESASGASGASETSGTSETGSTTTPTTSGAASTTGAATTGDTTSDAATTVANDDTTLALCPWDSSDGEVFCPLLAAPNIAISGDSPFGPVKFEYAYFGLFRCGTCPGPEDPPLALFAQAQAPGLEPFVGDYLLFDSVQNGPQAFTEGRIAGMPVDFSEGEEFPHFSGVMLLTEQQMSTMPLDPAAPPTISGNLTIDGEGWSVTGAFTASLCTTLDRIFNCG